MVLQAYDLWFESGDSVATYPTFPSGNFPSRPRFDTTPDGWVGALGPAISSNLWPRHPESGEPMMHGITLRLPEEYQRRGADFPGISFFQGTPLPLDPWEAAPAVPNLEPADPRVELRPDIIGGYGVLLWLSEDELSGEKSEATGYLGSLEEGRVGNPAWYAAPTLSVWLTPREGDPNAGRAPRDYWPGDVRGQDDYINPYQHPEFGLADSGLAGRSHLGGTSFPAQDLPLGLSPFYLEIDDFTGLNFGDGGNAQIDLETNVYDWACG